MVSAESGQKGQGNGIDWTVDSAATSHTTGNKDLFASLTYGNYGTVKVANDCFEKVVGRGTVTIRLVNEMGKESSASLCDVLYTPAISDNLLSVRKLTSKGYTVNFEGNGCKILFDNRQIGIADCCGELYKLRQPQKAYSSLSEHHHTSKCIHYWHRVLGHRDPAAIKLMSEKGLIRDMEISDCNEKLFCEICAQAKMTRLPFPKQSLNKSSSVLDLIHSDVCGPMKTMSPSGKRYILTFIDDFSRFTKVFFLRKKSETESKLKEYVEMAKTKFVRKPKMMRSDRGGEYVSNSITNLLNGEGIQTQFTAGFSPQQNGVAERKNRSLVEMARCMLLDAKLPTTFWAEAINMANYMQNRLPSKAISKTPYELWNEKKPGINHFRAFGSKCFVYIPAQKRHKLENTSKPMILTGYDEQSKAYRCYDPISKKLVISRDVRFTNSFGSRENFIHQDETANETDIRLSGNYDGNFLEEETENEQFEEATGEELDTVDQYEEAESHQEPILRQSNPENPENRKSNRSTKGIPPIRLIEEMKIVQHKVVEPKTLSEAINGEFGHQWKQAINEEMESLKRNGTWKLCELCHFEWRVEREHLYETTTGFRRRWSTFGLPFEEKYLRAKASSEDMERCS